MPHEEVSTLIFSIQAPRQEATRAQRLHSEKLAVTELNRGKRTMRALHAPQETLREYLKKHIPAPISLGDKNILNKKHGTLSVVHESVIFRKSQNHKIATGTRSRR